jgi:outer membrane protein assembly factor BamD (BamD/ComL family)
VCGLSLIGWTARQAAAHIGAQYNSVHFNSGFPDFGTPPRRAVLPGEYDVRPMTTEAPMAAWDHNGVLSQDGDAWMDYARDLKLTRYRAEGLKYAKAGDWQAARHAFAQAAMVAPKDGNLRERIALIDQILRLPAAQRSALRPQVAHYLNGMIALDRRQYPAAQHEFEPLSTGAGVLREHALYQLASLSYEMFDYGAARASYRKLLQEFPHTDLRERALIMIARASILPAVESGRDLPEGQHALQELAAGFPHSRFAASAHGLVARCGFLTGDFGRALEFYFSQGDLESAELIREKLAEQDQPAVTVRLLAGYLKRLGDSDTYDAYYKTCQRLDGELGDLSAKAATLFAERLQSDPRLLSPYLYYRLYHRTPTRQQLKTLCTLAQTTLKRHPEVSLPAAVRVRLAEVFYRDREFKRALEWAGAANRTQLSDRGLWMQCAALEKLGKKQEALAGFRALLSRYPASNLRSGAREEIAILSEQQGDLSSALTQYFQLGYASDVAFLLDVRMSPGQIARYLESTPGQSRRPYVVDEQWTSEEDHPRRVTISRNALIRHSLGIRYLRDDRWGEARRLLKSVRREYGKPFRDHHDDSNWGPDPLVTVNEMEALQARERRARGDKARVAAAFAIAEYYTAHGTLLFYNHALWKGDRERSFDYFWNPAQVTTADQAAVRAYMYRHESLARARNLFLEIADRYPRSPYAPRALYHAACDTYQMTHFNQWWNHEATRRNFAGEAVKLMKLLASRYPNSPLKPHALKYATVFADEDAARGERKARWFAKQSFNERVSVP